MKQHKPHNFRKICIFAGVFLLAAAITLLVAWQWNVRASEKWAETCVATLRTLLPEPQGAVPESRRDNTMPICSLDGTDFVGILEMPRYASSLPVRADYGSLTKSPSRFHGSIYDGTLQIGATTQPGQYDFYREISVGDTVFFTDMEGNRYTLQITNLRYASQIDQATLLREEATLTLFLQNIYSFEYLILYCS